MTRLSWLMLIFLSVYCWFFLRTETTDLCVVSGKIRRTITVAGLPIFWKTQGTDFAQVADVSSPEHIWKPVAVVSYRIEGRQVEDFRWGAVATKMNLMLAEWEESGTDGCLQRDRARAYLAEIRSQANNPSPDQPLE